MKLGAALNRKSAGLVLTAFVAVFVAASCGGASPAATGGISPLATQVRATPTSADTPAPKVGNVGGVAASVSVPLDFPLKVYTGEAEVGASELFFSDLFDKGKPVVLNFWAGLCPPCRAEMPDIQKAYSEFSDQVLIFGADIGPFVGLGNQQDARDLVAALGITYPTGYTSESLVVRTYKVLGMPTTVFLTPDGKVFRTWTGLLTKGKLTELIQNLLSASGV